MLNILADALLLATRFGPLPGDARYRMGRPEQDPAAANDSNLRNGEVPRCNRTAGGVR